MKYIAFGIFSQKELATRNSSMTEERKVYAIHSGLSRLSVCSSDKLHYDMSGNLYSTRVYDKIYSFTLCLWYNLYMQFHSLCNILLFGASVTKAWRSLISCQICILMCRILLNWLLSKN